MIKKSSVMVMLIEAADPNWGDTKTSPTNPEGKIVFFYRLGARHGKKTAGAYLCTGVAGYDGPTGNGTPNGTGGF